MATVYLRMYRIYAVFSAYEDYLKWQKEDILKEKKLTGWKRKMQRSTAEFEAPKFNHISQDDSFNQSSHQLRVSGGNLLETSNIESNSSINSGALKTDSSVLTSQSNSLIDFSPLQ